MIIAKNLVVNLIPKELKSQTINIEWYTLGEAIDAVDKLDTLISTLLDMDDEQERLDMDKIRLLSDIKLGIDGAICEKLSELDSKVTF